MQNRIEKSWIEREEMQKQLHARANRKYKIWTYVFLFLLCLLMGIIAIVTITSDELPVRLLLWLRGFAGVCAIASVTCAGIWYYKAYSSHIKEKWRRKSSESGD